MPFDQSTVLDLELRERGGDLFASWVSTAPAGTVFQLYRDRRHVWSGTARSVTLPHPPGPVLVEVGAVLPSESSLDLSAQLPADPGGGGRLRLAWTGGSFLSPPGAPPVAGFHVYLADAPGEPVNAAAPVATVAAYTQGAVTDGFGMGGFGSGGFGFSSASYEWVSGRLAAGTWNAAVAAFDASTNEGTPVGVSQAVAGPPGPVPYNAAGRRVTAQVKRAAGTPAGFGGGLYGEGGFGSGAGEGAPFVTLSWLASPGI